MLTRGNGCPRIHATSATGNLEHHKITRESKCYTGICTVSHAIFGCLMDEALACNIKPTRIC